MRIAWSWSRGRRRLAMLCTWLAIAAGVAAAARPSMPVEPSRRTGILELVVDTSSSTFAGDVAPTRLLAIEQAALHLIDRLPPRIRVGLVSFDNTAVTRTLPTTDRRAVGRQLSALASEGGTALGDALRRGLADIQASRPSAPAWMLLLSDGASTVGTDPINAARTAAERHVPVLAVAVGRPDATIELMDADGVQRQLPVPPTWSSSAGSLGPPAARSSRPAPRRSWRPRSASSSGSPAWRPSSGT